MKCKKNSARALKNLLKFSKMPANLNFAFAEFISLFKGALSAKPQKKAFGAEFELPFYTPLQNKAKNLNFLITLNQKMLY